MDETTNERHHLAELIWNVSRRDEGTISATGANIVAGAVLAAGYSRTPAEPDADERLRERAEAFLVQCGACDAGLPMSCACHDADPRPVIAELLDTLASRTPDAHLAAAKAEALDDLRERLVAAEQQLRELAPTFWESVERERVSGKAQGVQLALSYVDEIIRMAKADADEREQGGDNG